MEPKEENPYFIEIAELSPMELRLLSDELSMQAGRQLEAWRTHIEEAEAETP